jgi:hypothetical protein
VGNNTFLIAQPFTMPSGIQLTVTDSDASSPRSPTLGAGRVFRTFLAYTVGGLGTGVNSGTETNPDEWLLYLQYALNNNGTLTNWTVALTTDCKVRITYGGTGTGTITWSGTGVTSLIPRYLTGFDANVSLAANASVDGTYHPTHCVFGFANRANATNWVIRNKRSAIGETDDGLAYAFTASRVRREYTSDWRFHPYDTTAKTATGYPGTVYLPAVTSRWTQPSATPSTANSPPWSLTDFFGTAHAHQCGVALGNLQDLIGGSDTVFQDVTVAAKTLQNDDLIAPSAPDWSALVDAKAVTLRWLRQSAR